MNSHGAIIEGLRRKRQIVENEIRSKKINPQLAFKSINEKKWVQSISNKKKIKSILKNPQQLQTHTKIKPLNNTSEKTDIGSVTVSELKATAIIEYDDGSTYVGEVTNSLPDGQGTLITLDGDLFYGDWVNGKQHGRGHFLWLDGRIYIGVLKNGLRHGRGILYNKGESYKLSFHNGEIISQESDIPITEKTKEWDKM